MKLDSIDKAILNRIQSDFPIEARPYQSIARELNLTEQQVLEHVQALKDKGIIRRIGGNFVPRKVGFVSTLCAAKVPEDQIEAFAAVVNKYTGVTHNYQRENDLNMWFTFIAPDMGTIERSLAEIAQATGWPIGTVKTNRQTLRQRTSG